MSFVWPQTLLLLLTVPLLVGGYIVLLRRKTKSAVRYASLSLVKEAVGRGQRFRRHIPPLLFLLSLIAAIVAIARPMAAITLPFEQQTIILAIDVSTSMSAVDVAPNRITAAQAAAKSFIAERPSGVRLGIVAFGAAAVLAQAPTQDGDELLAAITRLQLQRGTATGSGLYVALASLLPDAGIDLESLNFRGGIFGDAPRGRRLDSAPAVEKNQFQPVPPGSYTTGAIILMSDGRRTTGPDPLEAAQMAADHGVRVFTVGFGTVDGAATPLEGIPSAFLRLDEETLKAVANITRGEYFHAATAEELSKVYQTLSGRLALEKKTTEITFLFVAVAAVLSIASAALSLLWFSRIG